MNLFSVFDPTSYFGFSLNWIVVMLIFVIFSSAYYIMSGGVMFMKLKLYGSLYNIFKEVADKNYLAMVLLSLVSFMYLALLNLMGLFPFIFTCTAHLVFTLGIGLVLWMSFFLMGWVKNFMNSAAHLVPEGSPLFLSPVMVLIESISHLMRPFTLSIRLAANMMAGHLIVGLLSSISSLSIFSFFISLMLQSMLLVLEFGVAIIQSFVFSILLLLYSLEYY